MKLLLWLGKMTMTAVFVFTVAIFAVWMGAQTYVDKLLAQNQLANGMKQIEFSEYLSELTGRLNIIKQPPNKQEKNGPSGSEETGSQAAEGPKPDGTNSSVKGDGEGRLPADAPKGGGALPVWNQSRNNASSSAEQRKKVMLSVEDLQKLKETISSEDKMKIFTLLTSRLPQNEIQEISQLVENGVTEEKLARIQSIIEQYLKPNEYQQLFEILDKY